MNTSLLLSKRLDHYYYQLPKVIDKCQQRLNNFLRTPAAKGKNVDESYELIALLNGINNFLIDLQQQVQPEVLDEVAEVQRGLTEGDEYTIGHLFIMLPNVDNPHFNPCIGKATLKQINLNQFKWI